MHELSQLIDVEGPAWPELRETLGGGPVTVEILPPDSDVASSSLLQLQVTARSYLGAVVLHCGALLVDDGWVRVFGSPVDGAMPGLARVNQFPGAFDCEWRPDAGLVVAHDVLGGVFALNGGAPAGAGRPGAPGEIVYFAPDSLRWEALGAGHSAWLAWLAWLASGALDEFYAALRWPGWRDEVRALNTDQGLSLFPPLWSAEARQDVSATSRRTVPMAELLGVARDSCRQVNGVDPGFLGVV